MKVFIIIFSFIATFDHLNPFDSFINVLPKGWSCTSKQNKLIISRDSVVKIQYFNYGMESDPPTLEHKYKIIIEYSKRLDDLEIKRRQCQRDSTLQVYIKEMELNPTRSNYDNYQDFENNRSKEEAMRIPFFSDNKYSYFIIDNFPWGYRYLEESVQTEIDSVLVKLKNIK